MSNASVAMGHCAWVFADDLFNARGIVVDSAGDVLVVERGRDQVTALWDANQDGVSDADERATLVAESQGLGLSHGIWIHAGYLYASSDTTVYRWAYTGGARSELGTPEIVVRGMPEGGHRTRTLTAREGEDWLYVSIGSESNVDADSSRSRIMRYDLGEIPEAGYAWTDGQLFADGLRNEVALGFDPEGRLWGAQNGVDNLRRDDLGGDIHDDNPAEEVNLFDEPGAFHGYPYCWTEFALPDDVGMGAGTQWLHPEFEDEGPWDDAWCRDPANVTPPRFSMQAHAAPLDLLFYAGEGLDPEIVGDALITLHGSWNRTPPTGYSVVRLVFDGSRMPVRLDGFLEREGEAATGDDWPHRPVGLAVADDGTLLVSSDASDAVIAIRRQDL